MKLMKFTPGGVQSTFASGVDHPFGLAFNSAGNLFVADAATDNIYEFTPGGVQSTFASGYFGGSLEGLAFNSAGDLFVLAGRSVGSSSIYEFTPGGVQSTFASGLDHYCPIGLAFNSAGDLFVGDTEGGNIYDYTPGGVESTFASTFGPMALAFQDEMLPVPEPSALGLLAVGVTALLGRHRRCAGV